MASDVPPRGQATNLAWLLSNLVQRVPHTRSALLLSSDGLKKDFYGLSTDDADHLAAVASGLFSLARSAGIRFGQGDGVRQLAAELEDLMLFVSAAGTGAVLAVLASREADPGVLGYEMAQLVKRVPSYLSTAARQESAAPDDRIG
jgi:predicted regulator of Ras-like GTPase activity (Roadblock/LC7/MglB family)